MKLSRGKIEKNQVRPPLVVSRLREWAGLEHDESWAYKLAAITDIGASTLQKYARDEGGVSLTTLFAMCQRHGLDPVWLLFGEEARAIAPERRKVGEQGVSRAG